jgi:hypothetical protein
MRRRSFSPQAIEAALLVENELRCEPPLPEWQVKKIARRVGSYKPAPRGTARRQRQHVAYQFTLEV